jgi:hypothetical protein
MDHITDHITDHMTDHITDHMTYVRVVTKALNSRNIISGWSKTGLRPFNPERVLKDIQKPKVNVALVHTEIEKPCDFL